MTGPRLALPAYFDPIREATTWTRVTAAADAVQVVILNPSNGPGPARRECYAALSGRLLAAGIRRIGYVNTDYGTRRRADVRHECAAFREWYGVDGIFLDQAGSSLTSLRIYEEYVGDARSLGCHTIVLNPGVYPHPAYLDLADLVVVFEGDHQMHRTLQVPRWAMARPPERFCHLVYGVRAHDTDDVRNRIQRSNTASSYITDGLMPNPWGTLPPYWERLASRR